MYIVSRTFDKIYTFLEKYNLLGVKRWVYLCLFCVKCSTQCVCGVKGGCMQQGASIGMHSIRTPCIHGYRFARSDLSAGGVSLSIRLECREVQKRPRSEKQLVEVNLNRQGGCCYPMDRCSTLFWWSQVSDQFCW